MYMCIYITNTLFMYIFISIYHFLLVLFLWRPLRKNMYVCLCVYTHIHTHTQTYIYIYTHTYTHTHRHIYIYIYTHTSTSLRLPPSQAQGFQMVQNTQEGFQEVYKSDSQVTLMRSRLWSRARASPFPVPRPRFSWLPSGCCCTSAGRATCRAVCSFCSFHF